MSVRVGCRRLAAIGFCAAVLAIIAAPVGAWCNGLACDPVHGNGYGTHDWIIDQAVKVFDGKTPRWFDVDAARLASDDPDTLFRHQNEHVYREGGYGRGGVHQVVEWYSKAAHHLVLGDAHQASVDIGRLAHFVGDLMPYHTARAAKAKWTNHQAYELLVDQLTGSAGAMPSWQTADRTPDLVSNIRTRAIQLAAYTRSKFAALDAEITKDPTHLSATARTITGAVLKRVSREIADMIYSVGRNVGNAPRPARLSVSRGYSQPTGTATQVFYVKVTDARGHVIEGAQVDVAFPSSAEVPSAVQKPDAAHTFRAYTMPSGVAKASAKIDLSLHRVKQSVRITVTSRGKTLTATTSYTAR